MIFNEEIALELIKKNGLSEKTIAVWKNRGTIPDRYAAGHVLPENRTTLEILKEQQLIEILSSKKINAALIFEKAGIAISKFQDAKRTDSKRVNLIVNDVDKIVDVLLKEAEKINFVIRQFKDKTVFTNSERLFIESFIIDSPFNFLNVLECKPADKIYTRFLQRKKNPQSKFEDWEAVKMLEGLSKLYSELTYE